MKNRKSNGTKNCLIDYQGDWHEAVSDGSRIETRCGIVAKNVSLASPTFKTVKVGHHIVTCRDCRSIKELCEDVKQ